MQGFQSQKGYGGREQCKAFKSQKGYGGREQCKAFSPRKVTEVENNARLLVLERLRRQRTMQGF